VSERRQVYVAVVGPSEANAEEAGWAEAIGRGLARAGAVVLCGGLGGAMDAVARGAESEGGLVVGILPGPGREGSSRHLTVALPTGLGETRNALIVRAADTVIAVSGEFGTLSEIALALRLGVPVVGLGTWRLSKPGQEDAVDPIERAEDPEDAVRRALAVAEGSS